MPNLSSIFSFKRDNPLAPVWMFLAGLLLIEAGLALLPDNSLVKTFHADALPKQSPDWQIMGDSVAQGGIVATQLMTYLPEGQSVCNLAVGGTGPEFPYFFLKREIDAGIAPKAIIYAPSPHTFASLRIPLLIAGFCSWPEVYTVGREGLKPMEVLYGVICRFSYTLRNRDQIAGLIKTGHAIKTVDGVFVADSPSLAQKPQPHWTLETLDARYKQPFLRQPFNEDFFMKFLGLAKSNGIPIYWATLPVMPVVYESRSRHEFQNGYYGFLDVLHSSGWIQLLQRDFVIWNEEDFKDQSHFTPAGAEKLTRFIAEKLRSLTDVNQRLAGGNTP